MFLSCMFLILLMYMVFFSVLFGNVKNSHILGLTNGFFKLIYRHILFKEFTIFVNY